MADEEKEAAGSCDEIKNNSFSPSILQQNEQAHTLTETNRSDSPSPRSARTTHVYRRVSKRKRKNKMRSYHSSSKRKKGLSSEITNEEVLEPPVPEMSSDRSELDIIDIIAQPNEQPTSIHQTTSSNANDVDGDIETDLVRSNPDRLETRVEMLPVTHNPSTNSDTAKSSSCGSLNNQDDGMDAHNPSTNSDTAKSSSYGSLNNQDDGMDAHNPSTNSNTAKSSSCGLPNNQDDGMDDSLYYGVSLSQLEKLKALSVCQANAVATVKLDKISEECLESIGDRRLSCESVNEGGKSETISSEAEPIKSTGDNTASAEPIKSTGDNTASAEPIKSTGDNTASVDSYVLFDSQRMESAGSKCDIGMDARSQDVVSNEWVESKGSEGVDDSHEKCAKEMHNITSDDADLDQCSTTGKSYGRRERPYLQQASRLDDAQWFKLWGESKKPYLPYHTIFEAQPRNIKCHRKRAQSNTEQMKLKPPRLLCYRQENDRFFMTSVQPAVNFDEVQCDLYSSPKLSFEQEDTSSPKVTIDSCSSSDDDEQIERVEFEKGDDEVDKMLLKVAATNTNQGGVAMPGNNQSSNVNSETNVFAAMDNEESHPSTHGGGTSPQSERVRHQPITDIAQTVPGNCGIKIASEPKGKLSVNERLGLSPVKVRSNMANSRTVGTKPHVFKKVYFTTAAMFRSKQPKDNTRVHLRTIGTQTMDTHFTRTASMKNRRTQTKNHLKSTQTQTTETSAPSNHATYTTCLASNFISEPQASAPLSMEWQDPLSPNKGTLSDKYLRRRRIMRNKANTDLRMSELGSQQKSVIRDELFGDDTELLGTACTSQLREVQLPGTSLQRIVTSDYTIPKDKASFIEKYWLAISHQK